MVGRFARACACVGPLMLGVAAWVRYPLIVGTLSRQGTCRLYATSIVATAAAYGILMRDRFYLAAAAAIVAAWLA